ncbi:MAG: hypothetical protein UT61_C0031G0012, partial [Candidatus Woesebacteria bacterium GW2011_GWA1_39_8]
MTFLFRGNPNRKIEEDVMNATLILLSPLLFLLVYWVNINFMRDQAFVYLAKSFLAGKTYFLTSPGGWADSALFMGHYYWPLGPFPAVVMIPFVYLFGLAGANFYQGHLQFILVFGVIFLVSKLVAKFFKNSLDIIFLTFAFGFSSAFLGLALRPSSWFFSQVIATFLLTLFLYEFLDKKRYWFLGIISALLFLTRITTALVVLVPLLDLLFGQESLRRRFIKALM